MKTAVLAMFILMCLWSAAIAQEAKPDARPFLAIPWIKNTPTIDGKVDASEWNGAAGTWGFMAGNGNLFAKPVFTRIAWNDSGVFICFITSQNSLKAENSAQSNDAAVYADDAVEVFLQARAGTYYHFIANSAGARYDARGTDTSWDCDWKTASTTSGNSWTCEMFIPYCADIPKPAVGDEWGFNFCRDFKDPTGWTSLAPIGGAFHNPAAFGIARFASNVPAVSVISFDKPMPTGTSMRLEALSETAAKVKVEWDARAVENGQGLGAASTVHSIEPGRVNSFEIPLMVPVPPVVGKNYTLSISISTADGTMLQKRIIGFLPAEDVSFKLTPNRNTQKLAVRVDTADRRIQGKRFLHTMTAYIKDVSGKVLRTTPPVSVMPCGNTPELTLDMAGLPDGQYVVTVDNTTEDGRNVGSKSSVFSRFETPDWKSNGIGQDDNVPAPWIPLQLNGSKLTCWNRTYDFGKSGLPASITAANNELLSDPVLLDGSSNGAKLRWKPLSSKVVSATKSTVVLLRIQEADGITMSSLITCDFDGMMRFDITLNPVKPGVQLDSLALRIPMPEQFAKYHYGYAYTFGGGKGATQPTDKDIIGKLDTPWSSDFIPGLWIGNATDGIGWFAEGKMNWNQTQPKNALVVVQQGKTRVLTVNFIDTPTALSKPITLTFGMQATPTKPFPRPKDWLTFRPVEMVGNKLFFCGWGGNTRWQGFPIIGDCKAKPGDKGEFDDTEFIDSLKKLRARGLTLPMYLNPTTLVTDMPEAVYFKEQWKNIPEILTGTDTGQQIILVCAGAKDLQDLYIKRLQEFMAKYDVDATYMDWAFCQRCSNAEHGCGYTNPDGSREATWPIFALHELHKRIYKVMKAAKPNSPLVTLAHPVGSMCLPHTSFWEAMVEGEYINVDIRGTKYAGDYTAFYSPERFTAEFSGRNWGCVPLFMAYVSSPAESQKSRTVFAMALMTGAIVWPAFGVDFNTQVSTWTALDKFGVDKIEEFLPYWDNKGAVKWTGGDKLFVTTYRKKGKALIVVSNLGAQPVKAKLSLDAKVLMPASGNMLVTDPVSGTQVSKGSTDFELDMPAKDFKLLLVE